MKILNKSKMSFKKCIKYNQRGIPSLVLSLTCAVLVAYEMSILEGF